MMSKHPAVESLEEYIETYEKILRQRCKNLLIVENRREPSQVEIAHWTKLFQETCEELALLRKELFTACLKHGATSELIEIQV